jgi:hypothetical protein
MRFLLYLLQSCETKPRELVSTVGNHSATGCATVDSAIAHTPIATSVE